MAYRYTMADLSRLVDRLNREVGAEPKAYRDATEEEKAAGFYAVANIGTYYLMGAYGGQKLVQITTHGGGVRDVLNVGYGSKREVYRALSAYLDGIAAASPDSHYAVAAIRERAGSIEEAMRQNIERRERFAREEAERGAQA